MSEIEELIKRIEELRLNMIKTKEERSYTDPEVVAASQELDAVLDKYELLTNEFARFAGHFIRSSFPNSSFFATECGLTRTPKAIPPIPGVF